jgi:hypothetical protein
MRIQSNPDRLFALHRGREQFRVFIPVTAVTELQVGPEK